MFEGRVVANGYAGVVGGLDVRLTSGGVTVAEARTDEAGRFRLDVDDDWIDGELTVAFPDGSPWVTAQLERDSPQPQLTLPAPPTEPEGLNARIGGSASTRDVADEAAMGMLYAAVYAAIQAEVLAAEHGVFSLTAPIHLALAELAELERLTNGVLGGDRDCLDKLTRIVSDPANIPYRPSREWPVPGPREIPCLGVLPTDPRTIAAAGAVMRRLGKIESTGDLSGAFLRWIAPLQHVFSVAARFVERGPDLAPEFAAALEETLAALGAPPGHGHGTHDVVPNDNTREPARENHPGLSDGDDDSARPRGHLAHDREGGPVHAPDGAIATTARGMPARPLPVEGWDPCSLLWQTCVASAGGAVDAGLSAADVPAIVGSVQPDVVCRGYAGTFTAYPRTNEQFPTPPPQFGPGEGLVLVGGGQATPVVVEPNGWTAGAVTFRLPPSWAQTTGCADLRWVAPAAAVQWRIGMDRDDSCFTIVNAHRDHLFNRGQDRHQVRLAILGPQINYLRANGQTVLTAEADEEVRLTWSATTGVCHGYYDPVSSTARVGLGSATIRITDDTGKVLLAAARESGELRLRENLTRTYTLTIDLGSNCGSASATVTVTRVRRVTAGVPERVFYPGQRVPVTVTLNYSAPSGGVTVTVTPYSTSLGHGTAQTVAIAAGQRAATIDLPVVNVPASRFVTVVASALHHVDSTIEVPISASSCLPVSVAATRERYGGRWDLVATTPPMATLGVIGIHLAVLHTGKVLIFSYDEGPTPRADPLWTLESAYSASRSGLAKCAIFNPATNTVAPVAMPKNLFCSHHAFLADGSLFVAGGQFGFPWWADIAAIAGAGIHPAITALVVLLLRGRRLSDPGAATDLHRFNPVSETWSPITPPMTKGRWYPTCVTLPDGRVFVISGTAADLATPGQTQDDWQIFDPLAPANPPGSARTAVTPLGFFIYHLYPFVHLLPSGRLFVHWRRMTATFAPTSGTWTFFWTGPLFGGTAALTNHAYSRTGPGPGTSVLLPLHPRRNPSTGSVEYPPGRVMILGGGGAEGPPDPDIPPDGPYMLNNTTPATNSVEIMDFSRPDPVWGTPVWDAAAPMAFGRVMPDAVLLPDGKVLVVNGSRRGQSGGFLVHFGAAIGADQHVDVAEIYDPEADTWEQLCSTSVTRLYHATAALLPDGRVLVAGHDGPFNMPPFDFSEYRLETYSPPYLFRGPRPVIGAAPSAIWCGTAFVIDTPAPAEIERVVLIRQGSITHQTNTDQRYVGINFERRADRLICSAPPDSAVAPPGYYMLFLVNRRGVPSVASWVQVRP